MAARFCSQCGTKLLPDANFCQGCGHPIHRETIVDVEPIEEETHEENATEEVVELEQPIDEEDTDAAPGLTKCSKCGFEMVVGVKECPFCGTPVSPAGSSIRTQGEARDVVGENSDDIENKKVGMKWFYVWTYIGIPLSILMMVGSIRTMTLNSGGGVFLSVLCLFMVVLMYGLHARERWAWNLNWGYMLLGYLFACVLPLASFDKEEDAVIAFIIFLLVYGILWLWPNYIYWHKRKALFLLSTTKTEGVLWKEE